MKEPGYPNRKQFMEYGKLAGVLAVGLGTLDVAVHEQDVHPRSGVMDPQAPPAVLQAVVAGLVVS